MYTRDMGGMNMIEMVGSSGWTISYGKSVGVVYLDVETSRLRAHHRLTNILTSLTASSRIRRYATSSIDQATARIAHELESAEDL